MVIWIILFAAAVFISCLLIEFAVQFLFGKIGVRRMCDKICLLLANLFKKIPPIYNLYFADLVNSCGVKDTK